MKSADREIALAAVILSGLYFLLTFVEWIAK